jgi:hypothetical protein
MIRGMKLMVKSEVIEVLKEGKPIGEHECEFIRDDLESDPGESGMFSYRQICQVCGRVEHVSRIIEYVTFQDLYEKFHGGEK